jgi:hypothetical protein
MAEVHFGYGRAALRQRLCRLGAWLLVGVVLLGTATRLRCYLSCHSYWYDEAYVLLNVSHRTVGELLQPLDDQQAAPPLFLFVLRGLYLLGGAPEWLMRLPAFVAGLAALALAVPLARFVIGRRSSLWVVGLGAICHHAVCHGCEVKPYAIDLLFAETVLLSTAVLLTEGTAPGWRMAARIALLVTGGIGPWLSYPGVFVLGAAAAALLWQAWRRRSRSLGWVAATLCVLVVSSSVALWYFVARHQHTHYLDEYWAASFPDLSSLLGAVKWSIGYLVHVGHYATTGLGAPLLLLALVGWVRLGRRSVALLLLLTLPLALAWLAGAVRAYPLADRLVFFAAPCLWLPAAAGADLIVRSWAARRAVFAWLALAGILLAPGALRMVRENSGGRTVTGFREAFAEAHERMRHGDYLWVSHPQVYEVYFGHPHWLLGPYTPLERLEQAARTGRVWMICNPQLPGLTLFPDVFARLQTAGAVASSRAHVEGLEIVLYEPGPPAQSVASRSPAR